MAYPRLLSFVLRAGVPLSAAGVGAALLLAPVPAHAQSAADKATARELATAGIKLYRAGKYKDALDKLKRAEALYDAPIHLLYIARCQVKLGKLVEGSETYRKLGRVKLGPNAPRPFKDAQAAGAKELAAVEPTIPALRVQVQPADVNDMDVVIDGEHVPAAIVGIDRPADPGKHTVRVAAPGFEPAETTVEVKLGEKKPVELTLKPAAGGGAGATPTKSGASTQQGAGQGAKSGGTTKKPSNIGFMVGLRVGATFFTGNAYKLPNTSDVPMSQLVGVGGGGEVHGGVRLWKYFTPVLFFQAGGAGSPGLDKSTLNPTPPITVNANAQSSYQGGGLGVMVGTPRNKLGYFGELDLAYDSLSRSIDVTPKLPGPGCTLKEGLTGLGARLGGGMVVPIASTLQLTPFAMVTIQRYSHQKREGYDQCPKAVRDTLLPNYYGPVDAAIPSAGQSTHAMVLLGVGGEFLFGGDKPTK